MWSWSKTTYLLCANINQPTNHLILNKLIYLPWKQKSAYVYIFYLRVSVCKGVYALFFHVPSTNVSQYFFIYSRHAYYQAGANLITAMPNICLLAISFLPIKKSLIQDFGLRKGFAGKAVFILIIINKLGCQIWVETLLME